MVYFLDLRIVVKGLCKTAVKVDSCCQPFEALSGYFFLTASFFSIDLTISDLRVRDRFL